MADATPSNPQRSSVLYSLGKLTGQVEGMQTSVQALPGQVGAMVQPIIARIDAIDGRLISVERHQWQWTGAAGMLGSILTTGIGLICFNLKFPGHF